MKLVILLSFALLATLGSTFASSEAHAGAYGFECTSSDGRFALSKSEILLKVEGEMKLIGEYMSRGETELSGRGYEGDTVNTATLHKIKTGKKTVLSLKDGKTSCGDDTREEIFVVQARIMNKSGKEAVNTQLTCRDYFEGGHCIGTEADQLDGEPETETFGRLGTDDPN